MFLPKSPIDTKLEDELVRLLEKLEQTDPTSEEYASLVERVSKLHKIKSESSNNRLKPPSTDTMLIVAANLFTVIRLTRFEAEHVLTSKALGFVMKPR